MATFKELVDLMLAEIMDSYNQPFDNPGENPDNIVQRYVPILEESVAVDQYININANNIMGDYPEDGTIQDKADFFIAMKEKKKLLEAGLSSINNVIQQIQPELIGWIESNPTNNLVGTSNKKASIRISMYPVVSDLQRLKGSLAEVWEEFEDVNKKKLGKLIRKARDRAKSEGEDIHELLPPGLDVAITKSLTISAGSSQRISNKDSMDDLIDLVRGSKGEEE